MEVILLEAENSNQNIVDMKNVFSGVESFRQAALMAETLSKSDLIPQNFRNKPANVLIAIEMANRIAASPFRSDAEYVCRAWEACMGFKICLSHQLILVVALLRLNLNSMVKVMSMDATAFAQSRLSGNVIESSKITWKMVKAEGWLSKTRFKSGRPCQSLCFVIEQLPFLEDCTALIF